MSLKIETVRDGQGRILGTKTSGFAGGITVARDWNGSILGKSSDTFHNTRDAEDRVTRRDADVGSLFRKRD